VLYGIYVLLHEFLAKVPVCRTRWGTSYQTSSAVEEGEGHSVGSCKEASVTR